MSKYQDLAMTPDPKKEQEYADYIEPDDSSEEYEKTYRDGSAQNECWNAEGNE